MADKSVAISRAGIGKQGFCKLCSLKDAQAQSDLDTRLRAGWNASQVTNLLKERYGVTANRQTIYSHKNHVMHPQDKVVTAVARTQARALQTKPASSNEQFLEAIRDIGYQRALDNPDEVTIDQSLKATQILVSQKQSGGNMLILLTKVVTGGDWRSDVVIEGQAQEVTD